MVIVMLFSTQSQPVRHSHRTISEEDSWMKLAFCLALALLAGCATPSQSTATVTDSSVAFADSESAALAGVGREHLVQGCVVQIIKTTDRGARVKPLRCPDVPWMLPLEKWPSGDE